MASSLLLLLWLMVVPIGGADAPPELRLLALSPSSDFAVLDLGEGELVVVRPGDSLPDTGLEVATVLADRLELEQTVVGVGGPPSRRRLWVYRARAGEPSRVQILDRTAPAPPRVGRPPPPPTSGPHAPEGSTTSGPAPPSSSSGDPR